MKKCIILTVAALCAAALSSSARKAVADDPWTLKATALQERYYPIPIGNGAIGLLTDAEPFRVKSVILNNVYDSRSNRVSTHFDNLNPFCLNVKIDGEAPGNEGWSQTLDMRRAVFSTTCSIPGKAECTWSLRTLRNLAYGALVTLEVKALKDISLDVSGHIAAPKNIKNIEESEARHPVRGQKYVVHRCWGATARRGVVCSAAYCIFTDEGPVAEPIALRKGEVARIYLAGSVVTDQNFGDPYNEPTREVVFAIGEGPEKMIERHEQLWNELWQGDIIIEGDPEAQKTVRSALFHLYGSCREGVSASIPPFGMSCREYGGHIFWDSEIWMYPPMLFLNGGIARSMVDYRTDRLQAARRRAATYGYRGAMFPWESDAWGEEACPTNALTGSFEHHISACVAIGVWNYYRMTRDLDWLREKGWPLLHDVADFWVSRASRNPDGSWSVRNVVAADEMAQGVDDNAFTNGAAKVALRAAVQAAEACGRQADPRWSEVADGLRILRAPDGHTIEFDGYEGQTVKQADANLLAYPLGLIGDEATIRADLKYYEGRFHEFGPAMTHGILAVQWARLGEGKKAYELYLKTLEGHLHGPLLSFSEIPGHGDVYFMTGLGGFLQAVINGFCGLELTDGGVVQLPASLPRHWKKVTVTGVGPERKTYTNTRH